MKKHTHFFTLTGLIALMFSTTAFGQGYQSFFGEKTTKYSICLATHNYNGENDTITPNPGLLGCQTIEYLITREDTIMIGDTVYYQVDWEKLFIREDTLTGQIFRYIKEIQKEYLICDMSLNVSDTFTLPDWELDGFLYPYREAGKNIIVDSIDYINGKKVIYFSSIKESRYFNAWLFYPGHPYHQYEKILYLTFIEGIGPTYGPFGSILYQEWFLGVMLCVEKDDTLTHTTSPYFGCLQIPWGAITEREMNPVRAYPNPAKDKLHIEIDNGELLHGTLRIIDPIGQVVFTRTLTSNKETISIKHLSSGIYIIHYNFNNQIFHSKIVKY